MATRRWRRDLTDGMGCDRSLTLSASVAVSGKQQGPLELNGFTFVLTSGFPVVVAGAREPV